MMSRQVPPGRAVQKNDFRLVNQANRVVFASGVDFSVDANLRFPMSGIATGNSVGILVAAIDLSTGAIGPGVSSRVLVA